MTNDLLHEFIVYVLVYEDAAGGATALAHVDEEADMCGDRRLVQVCVVADDQSRLSTKLKRDCLQICLACSNYDFVTDGGTASEGDFLDVHVTCNHLPNGARPIH